MATCPFCHEFRDETFECPCLGEYNAEFKAGKIPPGLSKYAFDYYVWRKIRALELAVTAHPENYPGDRAQELLQKIVQEAEDKYQETQRRIAADKKEKVSVQRPRIHLY